MALAGITLLNGSSIHNMAAVHGFGTVDVMAILTGL